VDGSARPSSDGTLTHGGILVKKCFRRILNLVLTPIFKGVAGKRRGMSALKVTSIFVLDDHPALEIPYILFKIRRVVGLWRLELRHFEGLSTLAPERDKLSLPALYFGFRPFCNQFEK
jgi:hypothetical protein